jgi:AcrR family transcriptional regulator
MSEKVSKKVRLINAADKLFREKSLNLTTLADIAQEADVPLGNVYYYFKTKELIVHSVIQKRINIINEQFKEWEELSPKKRVISFIELNKSQYDLFSSFGDPLVLMCYEVSRDNSELSVAASGFIKHILSWLQSQFLMMSKNEEDSRSSAIAILMDVQGINFMSFVLRGEKVSHMYDRLIEAVKN